jgi:hypothetical protein
MLKIIYPNGKIYVGKDLVYGKNGINYFGSITHIPHVILRYCS